MTAPTTLFQKIWADHVIEDYGDGWALLHIDRHLLHDLSGGPALTALEDDGLAVHDPDLNFATPDHAVSSRAGRVAHTYEHGGELHDILRDAAARAGVRFFALGRPGQGIVHVMAPELAIVLPGTTVICGDSHTCTNGAFGAIAFGVGTSDSSHALATQTLRHQMPRQMRVTCTGRLPLGLSAKDLALHVIGRFGADSGVGHAVEFAGDAVRDLDMEGRMTLCNMAVELGARYAVIAPDDKTLDHVRGRQFAPRGDDLAAAEAHWRTLFSDPDARFDKDLSVDASALRPTVTWGTSPEDTVEVDGRVPEVAPTGDMAAHRAALDYMGLEPGQPMADLDIDWVFIGSCANSRLSDLRRAAALVQDRQVAAGVTAWVVPGSEIVKRAAEAEGLDVIFRDAGFDWREAGCSMCVAANGEQVPPGARCVSTSNRNFVGRQGPGARTHLASPEVAAAAAVTGRFCAPDALPATPARAREA